LTSNRKTGAMQKKMVGRWDNSIFTAKQVTCEIAKERANGGKKKRTGGVQFGEKKLHQSVM